MRFCVFPTSFWADQDPSKTAIVWNKSTNEQARSACFYEQLPQEISWQLFDQLIAKFIQNLTALGIQPQQLIAYSGQHSLINLLCYCAVLKMGARILMLNPQLSESQRRQILEQNQVEIFITDHHFFNLSERDSSYSFPFDIQAPATFTLTSGSSGKPKAVVHSIQQHLASADGVCELMDFQHQHSWLLSLPLFHVSGQGIVWRWLSQGATLYIDENKATIWETLSKVSHASLVPTQLQRYLAWLGGRTKDQKILLGGANIPAKLIEQSQKLGITTFASYGLTEMGSTVTAIKNECHDEYRSVGKALQGREVCTVENEIWVKGKPLALGYWLNGEIISLTNKSGWFATKDCGYWENGNLVVTGRLDNMFISGGENIQPEEIERVLFQSNLVQNVVIVPIKDDEFGERPVALVEFKQDFCEQAVQFLQQFAKNQLEKFKQPVAYLSLETDKFQSGIKLSRQVLKDYVSKNVDLKG
ncbi:2-succinylbenzoate--CoA ligase [Phocoenobacter uteri]|uniref:2-succinylbenzoate--CoA ligase n=1 Tax=Phocoenobacter uteri TaxID=146806 RepID=A0A379C8Z1_9PAST|nr:o-succinylbenzoate--CoA ligase [Phocoenobacter uteri]MDG6882610.1 o-succinylbenzoate--CoA ligase [Phocoenobacter uteri]SUB58773.1 2-succinylbenzoate--CoA ligase [Phocoenobacter uteri]